MATVTETWTTPGVYNWTVPDGVTSVNMYCVAGGGGGGSWYSGYDSAGGGGGGASAVKIAYSVTPGDSFSIQCGAGGAAETNGSASYIDRFGPICYADFGRCSVSSSPGNGGSNFFSSGDFTYSGGNGGNGWNPPPDGTASGAGGGSAGRSSAGNDGTGAGESTPGVGGSAVTGGGAGANGVNGPNSGLNGGLGSGGSGASQSGTGGTGGNGYVEISYESASVSIAPMAMHQFRQRRNR